MRRVAVILFSMGGPDRLEAVRPFLINLFSDPAILRLPGPVRWLVARLIAWRRAPVAVEVYRRLGGGSPLLANSQAQAAALTAALARGEGATDADGRTEWWTFVAMRYWDPLSAETAAAVAAWAPDTMVLLPLYPQWSTTTSASSLAEWRRAVTAAGLRVPDHAICCYPDEPGFIAALTDGIAGAMATVPAGLPVRLLLSAHGLPESIVAAGDPYPDHCARTRDAVMAALALRQRIRPVSEATAAGEGALPPSVLCYQSRVGPMTWIGPATEAEIRRAGADGVGVILVPIAFVSEHSETLVELDQEYRELAHRSGVPYFVRVPTVGVAPAFISGLAGLVRRALGAGQAPISCGPSDGPCGRGCARTSPL